MDYQALPGPVDPLTDVKISEDRIWVDGCFDFAHHGLRARCSLSWRVQRAYWNQDMLAPCYKPEDWVRSF